MEQFIFCWPSKFYPGEYNFYLNIEASTSLLCNLAGCYSFGKELYYKKMRIY